MIDNIRHLNLDILHQQAEAALTARALFAFQSLVRGDPDLSVLAVYVLEAGFDEAVAVVDLEYPVPWVRVESDEERQLGISEESVGHVDEILWCLVDNWGVYFHARCGGSGFNEVQIKLGSLLALDEQIIGRIDRYRG